MPKYVLVRSPAALPPQGWVGYGWSNVDFSRFASAQALLAHFRAEGIDYGRKGNQIRRYFALGEGDRVIVPMGSHIVIGEASGQKAFELGVAYGENRVAVSFLKHADGSLVRIPRNQLPQGLASRLKIRMAIAPLDEFAEKVEWLIHQARDEGAVSLDRRIETLEYETEEAFKAQLLANLRQGRTYLESGGYGLEQLVLELLTLEGYEGRIEAKNARADLGDVDIAASRTDAFSSTRLLVQVKHHDGVSGLHGLRQLEALEDDEEAIRCFVTSAEVSDTLRERAEAQGIRVMDGADLVEWLVGHLEGLSRTTRQRLGIGLTPTLLLSTP
ncbi:restriction endonuclease [Halomonas sp. 328]|uniref:restriction endonuclease n=1 Tax=Halomonas sp. 328 TaxID=2776704 RepID=UPI0018A6DB12|nr:restriction endonuclease [Halomonas sp. 328]MBF8221052.1 restriction endonuclease [Halomonas sp. 328]